MTRERPRPGGPQGRPRPRSNVGPKDPTARNRQLLARYEKVFRRQPQDTFAIDRIFELASALPEGVRGYVNAVLSGGASYEMHLLAGHLFGRLGDGVAARQKYQDAVINDAKRPEAHASLGRLLIEQGKFDEGARELQTALKETPIARRGSLLRQLMELHLRSKEVTKAEERFEELRKVVGGGVQPVIDFANTLEQHGFIERAIEKLRAVRGGGRSHALLVRRLGEMELQTGQLEQAKQDLWSAHRLARDSGMRGEVEGLLFEAYRQSGELPKLASELKGKPHSIKTSIRISEEIGDSKQAIDLYRKALRVSPGDEQLRTGFVRALQRIGDAEGAIREQTALLRSSRQPAEHVMRFAELVSSTKSREDALRTLEQIANARRRDADFFRALAELYARWNLSAEYGKALAQLAKIDGRDPSNLEALGRYRYETGDRQGAIEVWRGVLSGRPGLTGRVRYAQILMSNGLFREAAKQYRELLVQHPESLEVVRGLGEACDAARDYSCAAEAWTKAIELAPEGSASERQARSMLVTSWLRGQTAARERQRLKKQLEGNPNDIETARQLLELLRRQGQRFLPEAEELALRLTETVKGDLSIWQDLERIRLARGDREGAIKALEAQARLQPQKATTALRRMVEHAEAIYQDEQALRYAERAVKLAPRSAEPHRILGRLLHKKGSVREAIKHYEKAIDLDPRQLPVYGVLSELYRSEKNLAAAATVCRKFLEQAPEDDLVDAAFRGCVDMSIDADALGPLEGVLLALTYEHPERTIFRRALLELYARPERTEALSERALRPALDALLDPSPMQRSLGVALLRKLAQSQAVAPLLALAARDDDEPLLRYEAFMAAVSIAEPKQADMFADFSRQAEGALELIASWAAFAKMRVPIAKAERAEERLLAALALVARGEHLADADAERLRSWLAVQQPSTVRTAIALALGARDEEWSGDRYPKVQPDAVGWVRLALANNEVGRLILADNWSLGEREALTAILFSFLESRAFKLLPPRFGEREAAYVRRIAEHMLASVTFDKADQTSWARTVEFLSIWAAEAEHVTELRTGRDLKITCGHVVPAQLSALGCGSLRAELRDALRTFERAISKRAQAKKGEVPRVTEILVAAQTPESGELARRALSSPDSHQRWSILLALSDRPEVASRLVAQLSKLAELGSNWEERWAAVQALPVTAHTQKLLHRVAQRDRNAMVRSAAQAKLAGQKARTRPIR